MTDLYMVRCSFDSPSLISWAREQAGIRAVNDFGYVVHAVFKAGFGEEAPKPFVLDKNHGRTQFVLGYSKIPGSDLEDLCKENRPELINIFDQKIPSKAMPTDWPMGGIFGFSVLMAPIVRQSKPVKRERDAYFASLDAGGEKSLQKRERVYLDLLKREISRDGAASVLEAGLTAIKQNSVQRRSYSEVDQERKLKPFQRSVAEFKGRLQIKNPETFQKLMMRGVGRHRAFGLGMLLLRRN